MKYAIVLSIIFFAGCTVSQHSTLPPDTPELISMSPLPVYSSHSYMADMALEAVYHVRTDGTIVDVEFVRGSGDTAWDQAAVDLMKHWRFTSIPRDDPDEVVLIRSRLIVHVESPAVMSLGMLVVSTQAEADTLYAQLERGVAFESLASSARWDSVVKRGRYTGSVDIGRYPQHVREQLRRLSLNEFTRPIRLGAEYVIYKRLADSQALLQ